MLSSILITLVVLSILILVHELGHFLVAKKNGVWVEEFGIGLPPRIWSKKIGETEYSINALPFGGFVRLHGENTDEELEKPRRAFINKSKKARVAITIAGVAMNVLLAVVAFGIVYSFSGIPRQTNDVEVLEVATDSPAQQRGIIIGDIIKKVDKVEVDSVDKFVSLIEEKKGKRVVLEIKRQEEVKKITLRPRQDPPEGEGALGETITSTEIYYPPLWQRPFVGIYHGIKEAIFWGKTLVVGICGIFVNLFKGVKPKGIAGPVGIFAVTSQAATYGILALINFVGILSMNLAILNIIPFPALDGGRLLFIAIERVIGKKVVPRIESIIHAVGMAILILLLIALTANDIKNLISAGSISGFLEKILK